MAVAKETAAAAAAVAAVQETATVAEARARAGARARARARAEDGPGAEIRWADEPAQVRKVTRGAEREEEALVVGCECALAATAPVVVVAPAAEEEVCEAS